jgi:hypothetical protein
VAAHHGTDPTIYRTSRQGDFSYDIPLKAGIYEPTCILLRPMVRKMQAGQARGSRRMTVTAGKPLLTDFDVLADAEAAPADVRVFSDIRRLKMAGCI